MQISRSSYQGVEKVRDCVLLIWFLISKKSIASRSLTLGNATIPAIFRKKNEQPKTLTSRLLVVIRRRTNNQNYLCVIQTALIGAQRYEENKCERLSEELEKTLLP